MPCVVCTSMPEPASIPLPHVYDRLKAVSSSLGRRYSEVAAVLQRQVSADELDTWARYCEHLAQSGWRAWESTEAFCRVSPFLLRQVGAPELWNWAEEGKVLARHAADVATAFFRAARVMAPRGRLDEMRDWTAGAHWYLQHYPAQPSLAVAYLQVSPQLYGRYPPAVYNLWQQLAQALARAGGNQARRFFDISRAFLEHDRLTDPGAAWDLALRVVPVSADLALQALQRYPDLVHRLGPHLMTLVRDIVFTLLASDVAQADTFLRLVSGTLSLVPAAAHRQALEWCEEIARVNPDGTLAFLQQAPDLMRRLPGDRLPHWITTGLDIAARNTLAAEAYFALESVTAQARLHELQGQVSFAEAKRVLQLYTEGFAGRPIDLRTTETMSAGLQRGEHDLPTSDGAALFVPAQVATFPQAHENFAVYKVAILHQLGFYACGTFAFTMTAYRQRLPQGRHVLPRDDTSANGEAGTALAQFFAAFEQPDLARHLFTILEDARIDATLARRYKGLRPDLERLMHHSLQQRPAVWELPLRQALLEGLLQATLGRRLSARVPPGLRVLLQRLTQRAEAVQAVAASVYDTANAVVDCYHLMTQIPRLALSELAPNVVAQLEALADGLPDDADLMSLADLFRQAGDGADTMPMLPEGTEPTEGVEPVPYRGEMKPELIQKKMQLQDLTEELEHLQDALSPIPPEILKELLEKGDVEITSLQDGELSATSGLFMTDLEGRDGQLSDALERHDKLQREIAALDAELLEEFGDLASHDPVFLYDEWDYLIQDYRREWCRLTETVLDEDGIDFVQETRQKYTDLLTLVRRQFQLLKPELFKKIKRLIDGEEIDLDSAIEALIDRRAGNLLSEKVYMRRHKRDRDVAAVFLLDMSASTDDEVPQLPDTSVPVEPEPEPPRRFDFSGFITEDDDTQPSLASRPPPSRRRIIDVEREALVLMAEALETLGDAYAVYGFSGYGRDQVDFFVAKEFREPYDERIQARIAAMKPHRSTRMGPAIRHAIGKLERQEARIKTLLMLSDGYPQDYDYGKDRKSKDYGIQDTMMALREAQLKGIRTFCITVDPSGHDYLREMCPDQQYLVIDDITALPDELPKVYRGLTT